MGGLTATFLLNYGSRSCVLASRRRWQPADTRSRGGLGGVARPCLARDWMAQVPDQSDDHTGMRVNRLGSKWLGDPKIQPQDVEMEPRNHGQPRPPTHRDSPLLYAHSCRDSCAPLALSSPRTSQSDWPAHPPARPPPFLTRGGGLWRRPRPVRPRPALGPHPRARPRRGGAPSRRRPRRGAVSSFGSPPPPRRQSTHGERDPELDAHFP